MFSHFCEGIISALGNYTFHERGRGRTDEFPSENSLFSFSSFMYQNLQQQLQWMAVGKKISKIKIDQS